VLGINTLILSQGGGSEGLGFAIPARVVRFVYRSLRKHGHVHHVEIKAASQTITPALAAGLGLSQSYGVIVCDVTPGGPADSAGLKIGDIVISADDRPIDTLPALTAAMYLHPLDEVLKVVVKRGNEQKTLYIPVIEARNPMEKLIDEVNPDNSLVEPLGILAVDLNDQFRAVIGELRIPDGVVVIARAAELLARKARGGEAFGVPLVIQIAEVFQARKGGIHVARVLGAAFEFLAQFAGGVGAAGQQLQCESPQRIGVEDLDLSFPHKCDSYAEYTEIGEGRWLSR
jgi:membrane-associated protease RseP (regulator of RpoE activity)